MIPSYSLHRLFRNRSNSACDGASTPASFSKRQYVVFIVLLVVLTLVKTFIATHQTIVALPNAGHDDALHVRVAGNILDRIWLGPYDEVILAKGPFWPIFIAACFLFGIPTLLGLHLLFVLACFLLMQAFMPLFNRITPWLGLIFYALLLFHPASIGIPRIIRSPIYISLSMLASAGAIALFVRRVNLTTKNIWGWGVLLGLSYACVWLTREESVWLIPLIFILAFFIAQKLWNLKRMRTAVACFGIPSLCFFIAVGSICILNYQHYGYFGVADISSKEYCDAMGAISRVKGERWHPNIFLFKSTSSKIAKASPTYAQIEPLLNLENWSQHADIWKYYIPIFGHPKKMHETASGHFIWAFRAAATGLARQQRDQPTVASTSNLLRNITMEINAACDSGLLQCEKTRSSINPPWNRRYWEYLWIAWLEGLKYAANGNVDYSALQHKYISNLEDGYNSVFQDALLDPLNNLPSELAIHGWAFCGSGELTIQLVDDKGVPFAYQVLTRRDRPDVVAYFKARGVKTDFALHSGFLIKIHDYKEQTVILNFKLPDGRISKVKIIGNRWIWDSNSAIHINVDRISSGVPPIRNRYINSGEKIRVKIARFYVLLQNFAFVASLILFGIMIFVSPLRRRAWDWIVCAFAILVTVLSLIFICALVTVMAFPAFNSLYMAPIFPLLLVFELVIFFAYIDLIICKAKLKLAVTEERLQC
jgi:hypothetical protein